MWDVWKSHGLVDLRIVMQTLCRAEVFRVDEVACFKCRRSDLRDGGIAGEDTTAENFNSIRKKASVGMSWTSCRATSRRNNGETVETTLRVSAQALYI
jgi:hypothetical protein